VDSKDFDEIGSVLHRRVQVMFPNNYNQIITRRSRRGGGEEFRCEVYAKRTAGGSGSDVNTKWCPSLEAMFEKLVELAWVKPEKKAMVTMTEQGPASAAHSEKPKASDDDIAAMLANLQRLPRPEP
jgi:hypothetical protein